MLKTTKKNQLAWYTCEQPASCSVLWCGSPGFFLKKKGGWGIFLLIMQQWLDVFFGIRENLNFCCRILTSDVFVCFVYICIRKTIFGQGLGKTLNCNTLQRTDIHCNTLQMLYLDSDVWVCVVCIRIRGKVFGQGP